MTGALLPWLVNYCPGGSPPMTGALLPWRGGTPVTGALLPWGSPPMTGALLPWRGALPWLVHYYPEGGTPMTGALLHWGALSWLVHYCIDAMTRQVVNGSSDNFINWLACQPQPWDMYVHETTQYDPCLCVGLVYSHSCSSRAWHLTFPSLYGASVMNQLP